MLRRVMPHPTLTVTLILCWILLVNEFSAGALVLGLIQGLAIPIFTASFWPGRPKLMNPLRIVEYAAIVLYDIVVANIEVAYLILFKRNDELLTHYLVIPLELTSAEAITALAGTITMTPGTVSVDLGADGRSLLVHCLHTEDPQATILQIKNRYERRLKEIFR